jgi:hypothetical protein
MKGAVHWYYSYGKGMETNKFGTFVWTSRILNSDISTFYKSKSFSSKGWETTVAV